VSPLLRFKAPYPRRSVRRSPLQPAEPAQHGLDVVAFRHGHPPSVYQRGQVPNLNRAVEVIVQKEGSWSDRLSS